MPGQPAQRSALLAAFSLEGHTAVVTGAAMGIGRQTALTYAAAGAHLVLADLAEDELDETRSLVESAGGTATIVPTDVTQRSHVDDLARVATKESGRIGVWANVAGIIRWTLLVDTTEEELDAIVAVNFKGSFWGCATAGRVMSGTGGGSIINVASTAAEMAAPTLSVYGMTKAAVIQLTRVAAAELGPAGIRVNAVAPGWVETPMTRAAWRNPDGTFDEARRESLVSSRRMQSPLGISGEAQDMAYALLYLAADASRFMTGQVLRPNGGVFMP